MKKKEHASRVKQQVEDLENMNGQNLAASKLSRIDQQDTFNTVDLDDYDFSSILCKQKIKYADQSDTDNEGQHAEEDAREGMGERLLSLKEDDFVITPDAVEIRNLTKQSQKSGPHNQENFLENHRPLKCMKNLNDCWLEDGYTKKDAWDSVHNHEM